jgi:hypothetical protein
MQAFIAINRKARNRSPSTWCQFKKKNQPGLMVHACNPSTWEATAGGSGFQGQSGYIEDSASKNQTNKQKKSWKMW